jgi:hypothetical protein
VRGAAGAADWNWHLVSMVVERGAAAAENRLVIYIDGVERAAAQAPAGFGAVRNTGNVIRAGNNDADGPQDTSEWSPSNAFLGYLDDIHILNYAQSAAHIRNYWLGRPLAELDQARGVARPGATPASTRSSTTSAALTGPVSPPRPASAAQPSAPTSPTPRPPHAGRPPETNSGREWAAGRAVGGSQ